VEVAPRVITDNPDFFNRQHIRAQSISFYPPPSMVRWTADTTHHTVVRMEDAGVMLVGLLFAACCAAIIAAAMREEKRRGRFLDQI
jgi:hypothetical protein